MKSIEQFWSYEASDLFRMLDSGEEGITDEIAERRLQDQNIRLVTQKRWHKDALLLLSQYKNPLVLLLVFAAILSLILGEYSDSYIVILILLLTGIFGFIQERNANRAVESLQNLVRNKAQVKRSGKQKDIPIGEVVAGDIILLNAGDIIPADGLILSANDLHVNESVLTGESFPVEKFPGNCKTEQSLVRISNSVFKGTNVINGTASILAVNTAQFTELGKVGVALQKAPTLTAFEKGIYQFGYFLMRITIAIALFILVLNILLHRPVVDSLLFALALAVGMAPELLPAIVTITLSAGAHRLASKKVIVKKLSAVQNLGEMNILCADKTGTVTEGIVKVEAAVDINGNSNQMVRDFAFLNAFFETGLSNPIDMAIRNITDVSSEGWVKTDEVPYDFIRKRLSVVVKKNAKHTMITKGAVNNILECCSHAQLSSETIVPIDDCKEAITKIYSNYSEIGYRTIAISYKDVTGDPVINKDDESAMMFLGFIAFSDPLKAGIVDAIEELNKLGVRLKLISGDNRLVVQQVANRIGCTAGGILTGQDLHSLDTNSLQRKVNEVDVFAEIEPSQKEQIIRAIQNNKNVVGFLGDGINDASALKIADVGISVEGAVDVAKEAADLVLLERNLNVIAEGVLEGRKTFMNTLKYIFVTTSANFGNMFSLAIASLFLPFLPLLPTQVLLNNFLSDLPALAIASDNVDVELTHRPRKWDIRYIRRFMVTFGLQSSIFDMLTFALLLFVFRARPEIFRTGWFVESLLTEVFTLLVIRTARPFLKSKPSKYLVVLSIAVIVITLLLPFLPVGSRFALYVMPTNLFMAIIVITVLYVISCEITKKFIMKNL